jgi:hypothetical protein
VDSNQNNSKEEQNSIPANKQNELPSTPQPLLEKEYTDSPETPPLILQTEPPMEVHAHTHSPRKKWTHYFWEFLMLFLAVFCGFIAENIREHYIEHKRAIEFAQNLIYDLTNDTTRLNNLRRYQLWKEAKLDFLIKSLRSDQKEYSALKFYQSLRALDSWRVTLGYSNTYDDLKTSGLLRYYTKGGLSNKFKAYYNKYNVLNSMEREAETYHIEVCEPFLDKNFEGLRSLSRLNGSPESDDLIFFPSDDEKITLSSDVKKLLLNIVIRLKFKKGMYKSFEDYDHQKQTAINLISLLQKEYHPE